MVSSAIGWHLELIHSRESFMQTKNNMGPKTAPWGSLQVMGAASDCLPLTIACYDQCNKNDSIQSKILLWIV